MGAVWCIGWPHLVQQVGSAHSSRRLDLALQQKSTGRVVSMRAALVGAQTSYPRGAALFRLLAQLRMSAGQGSATAKALSLLTRGQPVFEVASASQVRGQIYEINKKDTRALWSSHCRGPGRLHTTDTLLCTP